jgi:carboxylate-amine ligase
VAGDPFERRFGESPPLSIGLEEELMLVDAESFALVPAASEIVSAARELDMRGRVKHELFAAVVELNTDICVTAEEAAEQLRVLRVETAKLVAARGLRLFAVGTHPIAEPTAQAIATKRRYAEFVAYAGPSARRQGVNGLHVHIGMPSADDCHQVLETILPWLPVILAQSANSPYLAGEDTGLVSNRAEVLAQLPRSGAPPAFASYGEWEQFVRSFVDAGLVTDYTTFWWDIRPHPRFGTLEIRMPDQPTAIELSSAFVALVQALCAMALDGEAPRHDAGSRGIYQQNRWAASRFGPRAELLHPDDRRLVTARDLTSELIELVEDALVRFGTRGLVTPLEVDWCEADRQLEIGHDGGLTAVCADIVERTPG